MWAIYNSLKGWSLYDISERELQLIVKTLSVNEIRLTKVCQQSDTNWVPLNEQNYPQLFKTISSDVTLYPQLSLQSESAEDTEYFVVRPKRVIQPRLHQRYEAAIKCHIQTTTKQFDTETFDLSEGGLFFKDIIPDWVAGYFIVVVDFLSSSNHTAESGSLSRKSVRLMCSLVEDQKEKKRVQIVSEEQDPQFLIYKEWLLTLQKAN